jgi:phosphonate transport system ATP-binding protein
LDPKIGSEILDILYNICKKDGVAVICSLHQLQFAQKYADRIVGLANGRLVVDSNTQSFDANLAAQLYGNSGLTEMR